MPRAGKRALAIIITCLLTQVSARAEFWEGLASGFSAQIEAGSKRRANSDFFLVPGDYDARVTSSGMNRYTVFNGGPTIVTRLCFHGVQMDEAILRVDQVKGPTIGTIAFSDGTTCTVNRLE